MNKIFDWRDLFKIDYPINLIIFSCNNIQKDEYFQKEYEKNRKNVVILGFLRDISS